MYPSQLTSALSAAVNAQVAAFVWGAPGVGKSKLTQQFADSIDHELIDLRLSQLDPADIRGIPSIDIERHLSVWNAPEFLPREGTHAKKGILFFDELNSAHPATQTVAYQLILDRKVGDYSLPDGWTCVAAGNRMEDKAIVNRMSSALSNRFLHLDFDVSFEDWCTWAIEANILPEIISFIRYRPGLLHKMDTAARAFPTPRSWEFVSKLLPFVSPDIELDVVDGLVGDGAAGEFVGYNRIFKNLPDPDLILQNPEKIKIPDMDDPAVMYALSGALSARANSDTFNNILKFGDRMPPEYQTILIRDSLLVDKDLQRTPAFKAWTKKNANALL